MEEKLEQARRVRDYLRQYDIAMQMISHNEVLGCDASVLEYKALNFDEDNYGLCKNILIKDKGENNFWLVILDYHKKINFQVLREKLSSTKLLFATEDELLSKLGVKPGSVSLFSIINDKQDKVKVIFDQSLFDKDELVFHPNYNGISVFIKSTDALAFLNYMQKDYEIIDLPYSDDLKKNITKQLVSNKAC